MSAMGACPDRSRRRIVRAPLAPRVGLLVALVTAAASSARADPKLVVTPSTIEFGFVPAVGGHSPRTLTVGNEGSGDLTLLGVTLVDPFQRDAYTWAPLALPLRIPPGQQSQVTVTFSPTAPGSFPAELQLDSDDPNARSLRVPLDGRGALPSWSASPRSLAFRSLLVDDASPPQTVTLSNTGAIAIALVPPQIEGPDASQFHVTGTGATALDVGRSESYVITCQPRSAGPLAAQLVLNAGAGPAASIPLGATAVAATLGNPSVDWSFGEVAVGASSTPRDFTVRLEPPGLQGVILAVASSNPLFAVDTSVTDWTPPPGAPSTIRVRFQPGAAGEANALLTVIARGALGPLVVARLHGRGLTSAPPSGPDCAMAAGRARPSGPVVPAWALVLLGVALVRRNRHARRPCDTPSRR